MGVGACAPFASPASVWRGTGPFVESRGGAFHQPRAQVPRHRGLPARALFSSAPRPSGRGTGLFSGGWPLGCPAVFRRGHAFRQPRALTGAAPGPSGAGAEPGPSGGGWPFVSPAALGARHRGLPAGACLSLVPRPSGAAAPFTSPALRRARWSSSGYPVLHGLKPR